MVSSGAVFRAGVGRGQASERFYLPAKRGEGDHPPKSGWWGASPTRDRGNLTASILLNAEAPITTDDRAVAAAARPLHHRLYARLCRARPMVPLAPLRGERKLLAQGALGASPTSVTAIAPLGERSKSKRMARR